MEEDCQNLGTIIINFCFFFLIVKISDPYSGCTIQWRKCKTYDTVFFL